MKNLCLVLPPFAPDYSGVASALFELGGMIVIHDASGCTGNYLGYDEPRWMKSKSIVYCSGLRHMDAVLGNDTKVIKRIVAAAESTKPLFTALLGSPVPMVIGTDYKGIAAEVEQKTGIPSFGFDTKGVVFYDKGLAMGTIAILKRFDPSLVEYKKLDGRINIVGLSPLDFAHFGNAESIVDLFKSNGIPVIASLSMGITLESVKKAPCAQLNVAVSYAGIEIAKYMQKTYGIPYVVGVPLGDGSCMLDQVRRALNGDTTSDTVQEDRSEQRTKDAKKILIIGEQVLSCSIRTELRRLYGIQNITVACLFNSDPALLESQDKAGVEEKDIFTLLQSGAYTDVVADPLVKQLIRNPAIRFYPLPHVAVSSKLCWDDTRRVLSPEMSQFITNIAEC
ncbi:MAG: oxidoreductase [Treponema sp.]|nr:oxidoreductase [Treponema sp.]